MLLLKAKIGAGPIGPAPIKRKTLCFGSKTYFSHSKLGCFACLPPTIPFARQTQFKKRPFSSERSSFHPCMLSHQTVRFRSSGRILFAGISNFRKSYHKSINEITPAYCHTAALCKRTYGSIWQNSWSSKFTSRHLSKLPEPHEQPYLSLYRRGLSPSSVSGQGYYHQVWQAGQDARALYSRADVWLLSMVTGTEQELIVILGGLYGLRPEHKLIVLDTYHQTAFGHDGKCISQKRDIPHKN